MTEAQWCVENILLSSITSRLETPEVGQIVGSFDSIYFNMTVGVIPPLAARGRQNAASLRLS